jgi:hypothetical protein
MDDLLKDALDAARRLGLQAEVMGQQAKLGTPRADAVVRLGRGGMEADYAVELKKGLRPATLGAVLHQLERLGEQKLLIADYITPRVAATLKERRVPFLDAAGNAYIDHPGLFIWVNGQKPEAPAGGETVGRAFQPTGLQVVFALLCIPDAVNKPYRELAKLAGVAHGTVGWVIPELQKEGFVIAGKAGRGKRRLVDRKRLLTQWAELYARILRPRTVLATYYAAKLDGWEEWPLDANDALWGEEPAGALFTGHLRPGELTIYAKKVPPALIARQKLLRDPEAGHAARVTFRNRFWDFQANEIQHAVPAVLVYADLLANGDARCLDTAKLIYEGVIAGLVEQN